MLQGQYESCWGLTRAAVSASGVAPFSPLQCSRKIIHSLLQVRSWWKEKQSLFQWSHVQREAMLCMPSRGTQQVTEVGPWKYPEVQQGHVRGAAGPEKVVQFFMSCLESRESGEMESVT